MVEKAMEYLLSGTEEEPKMVALEFDEEDDEYCIWGLVYDGKEIVNDAGQCYPDSIDEATARKLIEENVDLNDLERFLL